MADEEFGTAYAAFLRSWKWGRIELGGQYADLLSRHPQINVLGGCCGTDHRHIEEIARACKAAS